MVRKLSVIILAFLFIVPIVLATNAELKIKSDYYFHGMVIKTKNSAGAVLSKIYSKTDGYGDAYANISSSRSEVTILAIYIKNGDIIDSREAENVPVTGNMVVDFRDVIPEEVVAPVSNVSASNETEAESNETVGVGVTGNFVSKVKELSSKYVYYIVGGIVFVLVVGFVLMIIFRRKNKNFSKPDAFLPDVNLDLGFIEKQIKEAEARIEQATKELRVIKDKDKVVSARKKFEEAKKELERIEKEGS